MTLTGRENMKNPLDTIREETSLLELFQRIMSESAYMDTIVKDIFKQENEIKQKIYEKKDNCVYIVDDPNNLLKELNEKIKPRNLKCSIENISYKESLINEPMIGILKLEPAFICRRGHNKIFTTEDELKEHLRKVKHVKHNNTGIPNEKQLIIIENNTTCVSVPLFELIEKSGALSEINNRIKPINLKCHVVKKTGKESTVLDFEPAFMCRQCSKIFDTEEELNEHGKKHELEQKRYLSEISKPYEKRQREHEESRKSQDRTR